MPSDIMDSVILETARLRLREITDDDFDAVHAYASDPEVVQYMTWGPNTEQDTRDFLERAQAQAAAEPRLDYSVGTVTKNQDRLIGAIGLHLPSDDAHQAMLGYCYRREAWGQGYATEAASGLVDFGFAVLGLHRIWAGCDADNQASIRVLEKLGMTLEGRHREDVRVRGSFRDSLMFGLLEGEWENEMSRGEHE